MFYKLVFAQIHDVMVNDAYHDKPEALAQVSSEIPQRKPNFALYFLVLNIFEFVLGNWSSTPSGALYFQFIQHFVVFLCIYVRQGCTM